MDISIAQMVEKVKPEWGKRNNRRLMETKAACLTRKSGPPSVSRFPYQNLRAYPHRLQSSSVAHLR